MTQSWNFSASLSCKWCKWNGLFSFFHFENIVPSWHLRITVLSITQKVKITSSHQWNESRWARLYVLSLQLLNPWWAGSWPLRVDTPPTEMAPRWSLGSNSQLRVRSLISTHCHVFVEVSLETQPWKHFSMPTVAADTWKLVHLTREYVIVVKWNSMPVDVTRQASAKRNLQEREENMANNKSERSSDSTECLVWTDCWHPGTHPMIQSSL